ncbi:methyl-accepting chemotaxis protein [Pseudomonas koreensis]
MKWTAWLRADRDQIAGHEQTNLLALKATIEAARAGQANFRLPVPDDFRALAQHTQNAATHE